MDDAIFEAMNMRSARKFTNTFGFQAKDLLDRLEAAHIFPHATERNEFGLESFFDMLELFWAESEVEALRQHLALPEHEKTNILVISEDAHTLWGDHRWCVDPVDDGSDNNSMVLEFLWLAQAHTPTSAVDHTTPRANMRIAVDDGPTMRRLAGGDRITLRTVDAKLYPLPDRRIMKLQKALHMALRASAAAEVTDLLFPRNPPSSSPPVSIPKDAEENTTPDFTSFVLEAAVENCSINKSELPGLWESYGLDTACDIVFVDINSGAPLRSTPDDTNRKGKKTGKSRNKRTKKNNKRRNVEGRAQGRTQQPEGTGYLVEAEPSEHGSDDNGADDNGAGDNVADDNGADDSGADDNAQVDDQVFSDQEADADADTTATDDGKQSANADADEADNSRVGVVDPAYYQALDAALDADDVEKVNKLLENEAE
ncbi:hypothetical protein GE09DRAFT_1220850 [Coniochaeta sp. 2T2.1]|nr:hypothetical protein GE09DRAFT_1220850 [Coniochaeta sp. 2T2.1]